ncbi:DHA1 family chloramphenicol resistance protein-like MFS transporter [Lentzea atacamensis]|uniref:DHA1 family chloramphenicol resistance protein-like MFS transporter n=2 Tax=Lentzea TaxID=165301 RepID=A0A316IBE3_9PSEU|nr:Cmx/CmrA family chloramphenicol efflux MFS transporter [Lentzea atacamensis]PWK90531.1 DHA1 family chloramphenicol resistance protein-like MFS transporter [Lentzea atacamensis]
MPLSLYLLALAVFAMGTSEFMLAGLLPAIAGDVGVPVGTAGLLTSAFAAGMVVGAPLMAVIARNWSPRSSLFAFVVVFLIAHLVGAATADFAVLLMSRLVAALANAGFLAVALTTAAALVSPQRRGQALAVLLSGTTVATIAGVPGGSLLGTALGWRATFVAVAVLCVPAAIGVLAGTPVRRVRTAPPALRPELAELGKPRLVLVILLAVLVNAVTFGHFTFLAPVVTDVAGLSEWWVPVVLVLFGVGAFLGVTLGGRLADSSPRPVVVLGGPLLLAGWSSLDVLGREPIALLVLVFLLGVLSFAVGSTLIARVLHHAAGAPTMAGSYATAALNIGAVIGPLAMALSF